MRWQSVLLAHTQVINIYDRQKEKWMLSTQWKRTTSKNIQPNQSTNKTPQSYTSNEAKHSPARRIANGSPAGSHTQIVPAESAPTNKSTQDTITRRDIVSGSVPPDDNKRSRSEQPDYQAAIEQKPRGFHHDGRHNSHTAGPRSNTTTQR